jgi:hypothetical protein
MERQPFALPTEVSSVHVAPESVEVQMFPLQQLAASLVPSLDEVMECQSLPLPVEVFSVHVAPESVEVQMFPLETTAASLVPSLDEVMELPALTAPRGGVLCPRGARVCGGPDVSTEQRRRVWYRRSMR